MKAVKITIVVLSAALLAIGIATTSFAFHSGGVAECVGCHSMHAPKVGGSFLLIGSDQSSTCLTCHEQTGLATPSSYHISTAAADMPVGVPPKQRTPGGDFGWLKKGYSWVVRGTTTLDLAETHGHNVVAADYAYIADPTNTNAPGGTFTSSQLGCQSCHDPHSALRRDSAGAYVKPVLGQAVAPIIGSGSYKTSVIPAAGQAVGAYRLLRGLNDSSQTGATFAGVAIAVAPSTYNQTEATNQVRVAYGAAAANTWGNWCATCHTGMHSSGNYVHPIDQSIGTDIAANYNAYVKSGDLTGTAATSFTSLVPFASNTGDIVSLQALANNTLITSAGPATSDKVMCLSCHRAHASGFPEMLRFNLEGEFMVYNSLYPGTDTTPTVPQFSRGRLGVETQAAYYDRPVTQFATYQRVLCNKCHAKD
jgi:predicted CXXCH cytochrome family protein